MHSGVHGLHVPVVFDLVVVRTVIVRSNVVVRGGGGGLTVAVHHQTYQNRRANAACLWWELYGMCFPFLGVGNFVSFFIVGDNFSSISCLDIFLLRWVHRGGVLGGGMLKLFPCISVGSIFVSKWLSHFVFRLFCGLLIF